MAQSGFAELGLALKGLQNLDQFLAASGALREQAEQLAQAMRDKLGTYQGATDEFPAWERLAASTVAERIRQGYSGEDPLLRSGQLRDDISVTEIEGGGAYLIGIPANTESAAYADVMERGSADGVIPPRPFVGSASAEHREAIVGAVTASVESALKGG